MVFETEKAKNEAYFMKFKTSISKFLRLLYRCFTVYETSLRLSTQLISNIMRLAYPEGDVSD
jgi:hypothetical protein